MVQSHRNADIAELICATEALKNGFEVFLPIAGSSRVDLVISKKVVHRVQVKKSWNNARGNPVCQAVSKSVARHKGKERKHYSKDDIDFMIVVRVEDSTCWIMPAIEVMNNTTLGLSSRDKFKNEWGIME